MLAVIPARGGSKGLPGKNVRPLLGKPLIAYTIEAAKRSKEITRIVISTDDVDIADVAVSYGAELPFMRPAELATDTALGVDNYIYTIDRLEKEGNESIKSFTVLQPTSPLRISEDIDGAIHLFRERNADSVVSYTEEAHPVVWHRYVNEDLSFENIFEENIKNRQDNRRSYYPNGCVFVFKADMVRKRRLYSDRSYAYLMPRSRSVDIDTLEDFEYAEYLMEKSANKK
ncbi:acylneuraminate cytidylyltransferase family protein [Leptospira ellisii]|uniref:Acylneuraminate cytidylyltransferase family protein n=1 Tax=Leptospira ellisii TaxID=2023197 RepID=A0A2N0BMI0_9LEPT|nr:acylneuraminate cytidylyltransferase family protein [Leptospira ellisii]MDV6236872.1 acylneuraminate cytidylyltransferase family protein [Leptospira ellisii]PJZ91645.1 N-acylneuraminate cytidylyltransferase [Leptospira ellisii]PKA05205.1 N-acylneuraminate cytidylyltransferase [Leptospira ellisii]